MKTNPLILFCLSILFCVSITACVSPYQGQANALKASYARGEISANDFYTQMTNLEALDLQRRQAAAQAWQQGCQNIANNLQQQQALRQQALQNMQNNMLQTRPVNTTGTIYTPSGQMYRYNSTSY